jgi:hypothetical protein
MNEELRYHLKEFNAFKGYGTTDSDLLETLREEEIVFKDHLFGSRWWETWLYVAKVGDKFIGYEWAKANRDESVFDLGWEFDWESVEEYEPKEITKTIYVKKTK